MHWAKHPSKILRVNASDTPVMLAGQAVEDVECFTYLGSRVDKQGGTDADVRPRIGKARTAFNQLGLNSPESQHQNQDIQHRWRTTVTTMKKIQAFVNTCLRRILRVRWPVIINNQNLWERTKQQPVGEDILQKRWRWIGHTLRKSTSSTTRRARPVTYRERGKAGVQGTPGGGTLRRIQGGWERFGGSLNDWPRIEMPGQKTCWWPISCTGSQA